MKTFIAFILIVISSHSLANDKAAKGGLIRKKFASSRIEMKRCLEYSVRQIYPNFVVSFAIKDGKAQDIRFTGDELKPTEVTCLEGVIKKIIFEGIASAQSEQSVSFRTRGVE